MQSSNAGIANTYEEQHKAMVEVESIRNECVTMINELKQLQKKENILKAQNDILARQMIEYGYLDFDVKNQS